MTFIILNLDTRLEDFKFWMAHELAHVLIPELTGKNAGEDFADAYASALFYPKACSEQAYRAVTLQPNGAIKVQMQQATSHNISLNTVFQQVQQYAKASNLTLLPIEEKSIHAVRNRIRGHLVSEAM